MVTDIIQKAYELLRPSYWKSGKMDSGLSLSERIIDASYIAESEGYKKKMKPSLFYKEKLFQIKDKIKQKIEKEKIATEDAIRDYLKSLEFSNGVFPTETLESGKVNCVSSTALFLSLSEMLDSELYENSHVGDITFHTIVRKKEGNEYENIDYGRTFPDSHYTDRYGSPPVTKPKDYIVTSILVHGSVPLHDKEEQSKYHKRTFKLYPKDADSWFIKGNLLHHNLQEYEEAIKCYTMALGINTENTDAQKGKELALKEIQKSKNN